MGWVKLFLSNYEDLPRETMRKICLLFVGLLFLNTHWILEVAWLCAVLYFAIYRYLTLRDLFKGLRGDLEKARKTQKPE